MIVSGNTDHIKPINMLFAGTFFVGRVVVYGGALWVTFTEDENVFSDYSIWQLAPAATVLGYLLNLFWMRTILTSALGRTAGRRQEAVVKVKGR